MLSEYWDKVWSRKYERYNRHHFDIWQAVLSFLKGKVLDLGCGPGIIYKDTNVDLTGVDWSEEALKQAKINYPKGNYILSDIKNTGLPDKSFDTVVLFGVLDYFENWDDILIEARRLRKEDGKIIATLLNGFNNHNWIKYPKLTGNWRLYQE